MFHDRSAFTAGLLALLFCSRAVHAQDLYQDIQREFRDENQLQRDVSRYQRDVATGHFLRAAADRARIQNDEANIQNDQSQVRNDLAYQNSPRASSYLTPTLQPHPRYPGYFYYPSQPAQLYYYPSGLSAPVAPPVNVGPVNVGPINVPSSAVLPLNVAPPSRTIAIQFLNPVETGVGISFAVDGIAYSVPSGFTQRLNISFSSVVEFDRGDAFGDARYSLTEGVYEFRYTDRGWELYKKQVNPPVPVNPSTSLLPRNIPPRSFAAANGLAPISGDPTITRENVPPPPQPASLFAR